jgi:hypothetical protein
MFAKNILLGGKKIISFDDVSFLGLPVQPSNRKLYYRSIEKSQRAKKGRKRFICFFSPFS